MQDGPTEYPTALSVPGSSPIGGQDERHKLLVQTFNEAQVDFLMQRTPKHEIKERQGRGGMRFSYVEHGYVTERLNLVFGFNWDFEARRISA
jgi:recombination DNA repair RAD52 pathway protein